MSGPSGAPRPIRRLDPATIEKIAAGEVIERPASVVKELVENAVDAGARRVTVRLRGGGQMSLEVADDGTGIPAEELALAFERHATSKLAPNGPLERIATLGFRGEALASIAAVAHVRIVSRPPTAEVAEGRSARAGALGDRFAEPRGVGTTVTVEDLFFNTPARRKFLPAPSAEQVEVVRTVERAYLANPRVTLRVEAEGREILVLPGTDRLVEAAGHVLGAEFPSASFELRGEVPGGTVTAVLGAPALAGPTSTGLYLAVNGRPIVARALSQSIRLGFGDAIPRHRFPVGVVHLDLDLDRLDVNVHPAKREVRFLRERELADALRRTTRDRWVAPSDAAAGPRPGLRRALDRGATLAPTPPPGPAGRMRQERLGPTDGPAGAVSLPPVVVAGRTRFELLGPVHALYWVAASDDGLVLVDQHAASERLLFDTLKARTPAARQTLVDPLVLELPPAERAALAAHAAEVRDAGFEAEPFGTGVYRLRSVPAFRGRTARPEALRDLLRELADGSRPTVPDDLADRATATIACHAAFRAGDPVEPSAFAELLRALDRLPERATTCPHGRPIMIHLPRSRLDRWFLRQGA